MSEQNNSNEITIKELILSIKEYFREILSKWWLIAIITALFVSFFLYKHFTHTVTFPYEIKFMVEGESSQPALGGLLGQFGIGQKSANPAKIQEVGKSNTNFKKIAFSKMDNDFIANKIIEIYNLDEMWGNENEEFRNFRFSNSELKSDIEQLAFKRLSLLTWKGNGNNGMPLLTMNYDFDNAIYLISSNAENDDLSYNLANSLYSNVEYFFETEILKNKTKTLAILNKKSDSLRIVLQTKNIELARFDDRSVGVVNNVYKSKRNILQQEFLAVSNLFSEIMKNIELAEFNLNNSKALFLIVDKTLKPIFGTKSKIVEKILIGIVAGLFLSVLFIVVSKFIKSAMNE
jgi:hypothetical protein